MNRKLIREAVDSAFDEYAGKGYSDDPIPSLLRLGKGVTALNSPYFDSNVRCVIDKTIEDLVRDLFTDYVYRDEELRAAERVYNEALDRAWKKALSAKDDIRDRLMLAFDNAQFFGG